MRRRDVIGRIGGATLVTAGGAGLVSGETTRTVTWEFADGRVAEFTPQEFVDNPETPGVDALRGDGILARICCCCEDVDNCVDCGSDCPCLPDIEP